MGRLFKNAEGKCQHIILCAAKMKNERKIHSQVKKKLREFIARRLAPREMLQEVKAIKESWNVYINIRQCKLQGLLPQEKGGIT